MLDVVFQFDLSSTGSSQSLFEVVNFLFELNDLVLFFIQKNCVVENSVSSLAVFNRVVDLSFHQTVDLVFEEDQSLIEGIFILASYHNTANIVQVLSSEGQENVLELA